jgi:hypothetical protein
MRLARCDLFLMSPFNEQLYHPLRIISEKTGRDSFKE